MQAPPHEESLLSIIQDPSFCCDDEDDSDVSHDDDDDEVNWLDRECEQLQGLLRKIEANANWCIERCKKDDDGKLAVDPKTTTVSMLDVLLDATRALVQVHEKGSSRQDGNGTISDECWSFYNGVHDDWGSETWRSIARAWKQVAPKYANDNVNVARELYHAYQRVGPYGWEQLAYGVVSDEKGNTWDGDEECIDWPAMTVVRKEAADALPKADPSKIDISGALEAFERKSSEPYAYGIYLDTCTPIVQTIMRKKEQVRSEYMGLFVKHNAEQWNSCLSEVDPQTAWVHVSIPSHRELEVERQNLLHSIIFGDKPSEEDERHLAIFRFVWRELEVKCFHFFEDAVDIERKLDLGRYRYI